MKPGPFIFRLLMAVAVLLGLYAVGWTLSKSGKVMTLVGLAALIAYLVDPLVKRLQGRGLSRTMAIAAVFLAFFTGLAVLLYLVVPVTRQQAVQIGGQMTAFMGDIYAQIDRLQQVFKEHHLPEAVGERLRQMADEQVKGLPEKVGKAAASLAITVASNLVFVVLLPMVAFLLLQDAPFFYSRIMGLIPNRYFEVTYRLLDRVDEQLGGYIRGVLVVSFCVATVSTLGLWICGLKYFFVIGPLMGLLNIIPIFGAMIGMGLAGLAMVLQTGELGTAVWPVLVGVIAQVLDTVLFTPFALSRSVDLHPLLVLVVTLMVGEMFGLAGMLLAVPAMATVKVVWQAAGEARQSRRHAVPALSEGP